jgi:hypothetical protein
MGIAALNPSYELSHTLTKMRADQDEREQVRPLRRRLLFPVANRFHVDFKESG